jgi:hypothetical protein
MEDKNEEIRSIKLDVLPVRVGLHRPERTSAVNETTEKAKERIAGACNTVREYIKKYRFCIRKAALPFLLACVETEKWDEKKQRPKVGNKSEISAQLASYTGDEVTIQRNLDRFVRALIPSIKSTCMQQSAGRIYTALTAKDPELGISRNLLVLNAARKMPWFMNEPLHLKYCDTATTDVIFDGHRVFLRWDNDLEYVECKLIGKRMRDGKSAIDASRWGVVKQLQAGELIPAGAKLQLLDDGTFRLFIGYKGFESRRKDVDKRRVSELSFTEERNRFMVMRLSAGHRASAGVPIDEVTGFEWSAEAAIAQLDRLSAQQSAAAARCRACGGFERAREAEQRRRDRLTRARTNVVSGWCHEWSRRIVERCISMRAGTLKVFDIPAKLFVRPFGWEKFRFDLEYKCRECGIEVSYHESPNDSKGVAVDPQAEDSATRSAGALA